MCLFTSFILNEGEKAKMMSRLQTAVQCKISGLFKLVKEKTICYLLGYIGDQFGRHGATLSL